MKSKIQPLTRYRNCCLKVTKHGAIGWDNMENTEVPGLRIITPPFSQNSTPSIYEASYTVVTVFKDLELHKRPLETDRNWFDRI
jgi:hypothetical protein